MNKFDNEGFIKFLVEAVISVLVAAIVLSYTNNFFIAVVVVLVVLAGISIIRRGIR